VADAEPPAVTAGREEWVNQWGEAVTPVQPQAMHEGASLVIVGKDQKEYEPLPAAVSPDGLVMTEWELSAEELAAIFAGGRIRLWIYTNGRGMNPVQLEVTGA